MSTNPPKATSLPTRIFDITPYEDEAVKPEELIQISGHQQLSLNARRSITLLWHNAHSQGIEENKDYTIELDDLSGTKHKGYEQAEEAVLALMTTILTVQHKDGSTTRVQFLGGNDMNAADRPAGVLTYSFDKRLVNILKNSNIWGKISLPVLIALSTKYAISLYENAAQWSGLTYKSHQRMSLEEFRQLLGVEEGKYAAFGVLNTHVIKPAVQEINALAPFSLAVMPVKTGRKVTHIHLSWWLKEMKEVKEAFAELNRPRVGRKARIADAVSTVYEPSASPQRLKRQTQKLIE